MSLVPPATPTPTVGATLGRYRGATARAKAECERMGGMLLSEYARAHGVGKRTVKSLIQSGQLRAQVIQVGKLHYYCVF